MLNIEDRIYVTLKVDGQDIGDMVGGFNSILLCEGNLMRIPSCKIALSDRTSMYSSNRALSDGNEVEALVTKSTADNQTIARKYRVFMPRATSSAEGPSTQIICILNSPKYVTESVSESYKGNSEQALRALAKKCGLMFSGPSDFNGRAMNDSQVWLNSMTTRSTAMLNIVRHSWMDANSGMAIAVTSRGEMRFRNLIDVINISVDKINYVLLHNALPSDSDRSKKTYIVRQARERSIAGASNTSINYGAAHTESQLTGEHVTVDKLDVKTKGGFLPINSAVKGIVNKAQHSYSELDCGNTHAHFQAAIYQNQRVWALFSERESVLVHDVTDLELFDPVIYRQADADVSMPVKATDVYIVIGKTVCITAAAQYAERLELARMSLTMKGNAPLVGPGVFSSEKSLLPDVSIPSNASVQGVIAASYKKANGLNALLQPLKDMASIADGLKANVVTNLSGLVNQIPNIQQTVLKGSADQVSALFSGLLSTVGVCNAAVIQQQAQSAQAAALLTSLTSNMVNSSQAVRQQTLLSKGSASDLLSTQLLNKIPYDRAVGYIQKAAKSLPPRMRKLAPVGKVEAAIKAYAGVTEQNNRVISSQWNTSVSSISGRSTPQSIVPTSVTTNCLSSYTANACSPTTSDDVLHDKLRTGIVGASGNSPSWCSIDAFPDIDSKLSLEQCGSMLTNTVSRMEL